jgi:hypothetical protein
MCASESIFATRWKRVFLVLEMFVIIGCLYGLALKFSWRYSPGLFRHLPTSPAKVIWWASMAGATFLLLVSPFFMKSLRTAAFRGWIVGVATFLCGLWLLLH